MTTDWFAVADRPVEVLRGEFGLRAKSALALSLGSAGPWEQGGIALPLAAGREAAERDGRSYAGLLDPW